jgi:hypothetical protein
VVAFIVIGHRMNIITPENLPEAGSYEQAIIKKL